MTRREVKRSSNKVSKLFGTLRQQGLTRTYDVFRCYWLAREIRKLEVRYDLELAEMSGLQDLTVQSENKSLGYPYVSSPPLAMRVLFDNFGPDFSRTTFIDLGSGKGLPMLMASHHDFKAVVGIEFASELHQAAIENIRKYNAPNLRCQDLIAIHGDVLDYEFPDSDLLVYLSNPFNEYILRRIIAKLIETKVQAGCSISVVYQQMRREDGGSRSAGMVKQTFEETGKLAPRPFRIRRWRDRISMSHLTYMAYDVR